MCTIRIATFLLSLFVSSLSLAGPSGPYLGAGIVYGTYDEDFIGLSFDDSSFGLKLFGGYRFDVGNALDFFAVEASYQSFAEMDDNVLGSSVELEIDAFTIDVLGFVPLTERVELFGKLGYFDGEADVSVDGVDLGESDDDGLNLGAGVSSQFGNASVRGELTWFDVDDADFWTLGVTVQWHFGGTR
jgi:OOP family OmpA-OmpF porin